jgi:hypothetical protein
MENEGLAELLGKLDVVFSRKREKGSAIDLPEKREELLRLVKRQSEDIDALGYRRSSVRFEGETYYVIGYSGKYICRGHTRLDDDEVPIGILRRLATNQAKRLEEFNQKLKVLKEHEPEIALSCQLENKSGVAMMSEIVLTKIDSLAGDIEKAVTLPVGIRKLEVRFGIDLVEPIGGLP